MLSNVLRRQEKPPQQCDTCEAWMYIQFPWDSIANSAALVLHMHRWVPVRHDSLGVCPEGLDEAEDVVPSATVEACTVLPQLKQDLIHLKGSWQGLNQHCCLQQCSL